MVIGLKQILFLNSFFNVTVCNMHNDSYFIRYSINHNVVLFYKKELATSLTYSILNPLFACPLK